jgi:hypothetical protein
MPDYVNRSERNAQAVARSERSPWQRAARMSPEDLQKARRRFVAWLRWYMEHYPEEAPSQAALARRMGVAKAAITYLFVPGSARAPAFKTLLAAKALLGMSIDQLLFTDPPGKRRP